MRLNLKRLGLLAGRPARVFAERAGLTPQRIDLMLLLRGWELPQWEIAQRLCVSRPVVSRMVDALVELELVIRTRTEDGRVRIPRLTAKGRARLALCFPNPTFHGAQDEGEIRWLRVWRHAIAGLGVRVDSILRSRQPDFFHLFVAWASRYDLTYDRPHDWWITAPLPA